MKINFFICVVLLSSTAIGQNDTLVKPMDSVEFVTTQKGEPLEGMDLTWLNGGDRRTIPTLAGKYFTPTVMIDVNTTHSFNNPIDNTVVGSTALARNNEMQVSAAHLGG
jgi:hypothetical protein